MSPSDIWICTVCSLPLKEKKEKSRHLLSPCTWPPSPCSSSPTALSPALTGHGRSTCLPWAQSQELAYLCRETRVLTSFLQREGSAKRSFGFCSRGPHLFPADTVTSALGCPEAGAPWSMT